MAALLPALRLSVMRGFVFQPTDQIESSNFEGVKFNFMSYFLIATTINSKNLKWGLSVTVKNKTID